VILALHGVFLTYLLVLLAWNALAEAPPEPADGERRTPAWRRWGLPLLHLGLALVLLRDRLRPDQASLLAEPAVAYLFPLAFALALAQNAAAMIERGARLTDIPIVLYNVGLGAALTFAVLALGGVDVGTRGSVLLYDHHLLQLFVGSHLAWLSTLSWHLPLLVRRRAARTIPGLMLGLVPPAFAAFAVLVMVSLHGESGGVIARFADEPEPVALRTGLATGVMVDATHTVGEAPGSLEVWMLPADHDGIGLPTPSRPLVLILRPPSDWLFERPYPELLAEVYLSGAERLAGVLRPTLILPFPDPDAEAPLLMDDTVDAEQWRRWYEGAREMVTAASPGTRIGARLGGTGARSAALFEALARAPSPVDVAGPRLHPGNVARGGPAWADNILGTWDGWRAGVAEPPELWVLAAGCSPLAYGEDAQARFLVGCLARASDHPAVAGILIQGWRDRGHTLGLLRPDGSLRQAGARAWAWLPAPPPMPPAANR
jgi:hypothetical protein